MHDSVVRYVKGSYLIHVSYGTVGKQSPQSGVKCLLPFSQFSPVTWHVMWQSHDMNTNASCMIWTPGGEERESIILSPFLKNLKSANFYFAPTNRSSSSLPRHVPLPPEMHAPLTIFWMNPWGHTPLDCYSITWSSHDLHMITHQYHTLVIHVQTIKNQH